MTRWKLATLCNVSESTIERWEKGVENKGTNPEPDDVANIEKALGIPGLWHRWMLSNYDSYRERYIYMPIKDNLTEIVVQMKHEMSEITPLIDGMEWDVLDGHFDNVVLWKSFKKEGSEAIAAIQQVLDRIPDNL